MSELPEYIGDFKVLRELGRGAMGVVYLALHESLGREMAIKVMSRDLAADTEFLERFRREGRMAASLRHPNIVQVYDFANRDGRYFIAMEYLGSRTLKDLLEDGQQPIERCCQWMDELLSALSLAHGKGIVHRDIKPANVMLADSGSIALTDFSVAHMKETSKLTQTGAIIGTPEYMAPEQFDGQWDARSDLYSSALVFYELLTGFSPFRSATMTEVMRKQLLTVPDPPSTVDFTIPESISRVVSKALEKDPGNRYQSAEEMRQAIAEAMGQGTQAGPSPPAAPSPEPVRPREVSALEDNQPTEISPPSSGQREPDPEPAAPLAAPPSLEKPAAMEPPREAPKPKPKPEPSSKAPEAEPPPAAPQPLPTRKALVGALVGLLVIALIWNQIAVSRKRAQARRLAADKKAAALVTSSASPSSLPGSRTSPTPIAPSDDEPGMSPNLAADPAESEPESFEPGGKLPQQGVIFSGDGVGTVDLGYSAEMVQQEWGPPTSMDSTEKHKLWQYAMPSSEGITLYFGKSSGLVELIAVETESYRVEGASGPGVGSRYDVVEAFYMDDQPSTATEDRLLYIEDGIMYRFGPPPANEDYKGSVCTMVSVFSPSYFGDGSEGATN